MSYVKSSEIGKLSVVLYRANVLGIKPISRAKWSREYLYTIEDAEKIIAYKGVKIRNHRIEYYYILEEILKNDTLRYNIELSAKKYRLTTSKIKSMLDEYNKSKCFVTPSKINFE